MKFLNMISHLTGFSSMTSNSSSTDGMGTADESVDTAAADITPHEMVVSFDGAVRIFGAWRGEARYFITSTSDGNIVTEEEISNVSGTVLFRISNRYSDVVLHDLRNGNTHVGRKKLHRGIGFVTGRNKDTIIDMVRRSDAPFTSYVEGSTVIVRTSKHGSSMYFKSTKRRVGSFSVMRTAICDTPIVWRISVSAGADSALAVAIAVVRERLGFTI